MRVIDFSRTYWRAPLEGQRRRNDRADGSSLCPGTAHSQPRRLHCQARSLNFPLGARMTPNNVVDLKSFVPARDFALSRRFYLDLGFTENWGNEHAAELQLGGYRFLLQNFYVKEHAENFMMHLLVEDADAWWAHI